MRDVYACREIGKRTQREMSYDAAPVLLVMVTTSVVTPAEKPTSLVRIRLALRETRGLGAYVDWKNEATQICARVGIFSAFVDFILNCYLSAKCYAIQAPSFN